jgi:hypothetical protein
MTGEVWRSVPSAPHFMVSNLGRIMVAPYAAPMPRGGIRHYGGEPYAGVWESQAGRFVIVHQGKTYKVSRLVCEAFHGAPPPGRDNCLHRDEDRRNNRPENLRWGTKQEALNAQGAIRKLSDRKNRVSDEDAEQMRLSRRLGGTLQDIASDFGFCRGTVTNVVNHRRLRDQKPDWRDA